MFGFFAIMPRYKVGDLVEVDEFKSHKVSDPSQHPKDGIVVAVFDQTQSPTWLGEKTIPQWNYIVSVNNPAYGSPLRDFELNFVAWIIKDNLDINLTQRVVIVEQARLGERVDRNRYPGTCPSCQREAYVGAVPNSVKCSNVYCKHAEKIK